MKLMHQVRRARVCAFLLVGSTLAGAIGGCDDEPSLPLGPPRCEPAKELEVERGLKEGFRALFEGDGQRAKSRFEAMQREEPGHPEVALGLRLAGRLQRGGTGIGPSRPVDSDAALSPGQDLAITIAGARVPFPVPVVGERLRFEELAALMALRKASDGQGIAVAELFRSRNRSGIEVSPHDKNAVIAAVDLIVLFDTRTTDARRSVVALEGRSRTTHFIVDGDGTIYQTLDLAFDAKRTADVSTDARSITIDLVNPVEVDPAGLPQVDRPMSEPVRIQGQEVRHWGYTTTQWDALERLVAALLSEFPQVMPRLPRDGAGQVPRMVFAGASSFSGVLGHLHLNADAADPGAGFPWERFAKVLAR